jgi:hypothetical protein
VDVEGEARGAGTGATHVCLHEGPLNFQSGLHNTCGDALSAIRAGKVIVAHLGVTSRLEVSARGVKIGKHEENRGDAMSAEKKQFDP